MIRRTLFQTTTSSLFGSYYIGNIAGSTGTCGINRRNTILVLFAFVNVIVVEFQSFDRRFCELNPSTRQYLSSFYIVSENRRASVGNRRHPLQRNMIFIDFNGVWSRWFARNVCKITINKFTIRRFDLVAKSTPCFYLPN